MAKIRIDIIIRPEGNNQYLLLKILCKFNQPLPMPACKSHKTFFVWILSASILSGE